MVGLYSNLERSRDKRKMFNFPKGENKEWSKILMRKIQNGQKYYLVELPGQKY